ncbi:SgcJ/EcaC family oxidoreductase (plasmid) [Streptomyces sp. BI20]|uniref:SgcJ/EcaC family oxidoreductase n=1 Tax=Streptomyces sp. BI20 TaxID=3403460 RepID=UPI003C76F981
MQPTRPARPESPRRARRAGIAVGTALAVAAGTGLSLGVARADDRGTERAAERHAPSRPAAKPSTREITALFDGWNRALRTGDPEVVAARYARDAVLLPTASARIRTDHDGIVDYFEHFLAKKPRSEKLTSVVNVLDENSAVDSGVYRFHLTDPKTGVTKPVDARYTYVYEKRDGVWKILSHHSSVLPAEG